MKIKEAYQRFRQWQQEPLNYQNKSRGSVRCQNCGTEFDANFCPICGQKAGVGRVTWRTVRQGVMLLWGMDSRSLSYTLLQLVLRPGYLIRDYISGRRQVAFPPVKMLLLVAMVFMLGGALVDDDPNEGPLTDGDFRLIDTYGEWATNNPGWGMLGIFSMLLLPTWLTFRYAPRYPKHTLPEGFFIAVFMTTLMLIVIMFSEISDLVLLLVPGYYIVAFRQLFGYGWWGTTWRFLLIFIEALFMMAIAVYTVEKIINGGPLSHTRSTSTIITSAIIWGVVFGTLIYGVHRLNKWGYKRRLGKTADAAGDDSQGEH